MMKRCVVTIAVGVALLFGSTALHSQRIYTNVDKPMTVGHNLKTYANVQKSRLMAIANQVPEDKYWVKPPTSETLTGEEQSIGHLLAEAANTHWRMCTIMLTGVRPPADAQPGNVVLASPNPTKAAMVAALAKSFETCDPMIDNFDDANITKMVMSQFGLQPLVTTLDNVVSHDREIYGKLMSYMAVLGIPRRLTGTIGFADPNNPESLLHCGGKTSKTPESCTYQDLRK